LHILLSIFNIDFRRTSALEMFLVGHSLF
jgi:hypothetical protein